MRRRLSAWPYLAQRAPALWMAIGILTMVPSADAQLRVVTYNTHEGPNPGASTVLEAIGEESYGGFAKPIDVLLLQEQTGVSGTTQDIVELLDAVYGPGVYAHSMLNGLPSFADIRQTLIYNTQTVELIGEQRLGNAGGSDEQPRQALRYQLRPVDYGESADFYAYNSHYKADDGSADQARRLVEAEAIRANADALGQGAHIIYAGDFNMQRSNESAFQELVSSGNGEAFDPINQLGTWTNNFDFREWHTQAPCASSCPSGFTTGGIDDRFDFQLVTSELLDDEGLSYIPGTYHTFGNNGTTFNQSVTSGSNTYPFTGVTSFTDAEVRTALFTSSDHLPVVADYQVPAILEAIAGAVPTTLMRNEVFNLDVAIRNAANVVAAIGADELDYEITTSGNLSGSAMGSALALADGIVHSVSFDTSLPGIRDGVITVTTSSQGAANALVEIPISYEVLNTDGIAFLMFESFESPPGETYTLNPEEVNDGGFDYFGRFAAPDPSNVHRDDFSGFHGEFAVYGEDHDGRGDPATVTIEIPDIDVAGFANFELTGNFAAFDDDFNDFEASQGDGIEVFVAVDGGELMKIGGFAPDATGTSGLLEDTDLDGIGDGAALTTTLAEFSFDFTASGSLLDVILALTSTDSQEHWAVDNFRLTAATVPGDYNGDGVLNAADYIVWRNHANTEFELVNENPDALTPGLVDQEDYDFWKSQFIGGEAAGTNVTVPEPSGLILLGILIFQRCLGVIAFRKKPRI
jgi:endonuclease/exonuclease/phosphatase family metal-dependent hydrolase